MKFYNSHILLIAISLLFLLAGCKKSEETAIVVTTTSSATYVGQEWAVMNGSVTPGSKTYITSFEFDTDSVSAMKYAAAADPDTVSGESAVKVSSLVTGLTANTTYFFRVKAVSGSETVTSAIMKFTTTHPGKSAVIFKSGKTYGTVSDNDGNTYKTIQIGTQTWMAENLRTRKFNDNSQIQFMPVYGSWVGLETPGYCWYNNDSIIYGALYNWYTVSSGKLCPAGWHVPTDNDWATLAASLGDENSVAGKLKEEGITHWQSSSLTSTNESGFTAIPGGYRSYNSYYNNARRYAYFWSSTEKTSSEASCRSLFYDFNILDKTSTNKNGGLSVRCVKD